MDRWTQRVAAIAFLLASIALLVGTLTYAYKEVSTMQFTSSIPKKK